MKKFPMDRFYIGKLNLGFKRGSLLAPRRMTKEDHERMDLRLDTVLNGAVSLSGWHLAYMENKEENMAYDHVYSLFYKNDDGTYTCLHNNETYNTEMSKYFVSDLVPFSSVIPEVLQTREKISFLRAKILFGMIFDNKKKIIYDKDVLYPVSDFYVGALELYTGTRKNDANLAQRLILYRYEIDPVGGSSGIDQKTREEDNWTEYSVVILSPVDEKILCIDDHRVYGEDLEPYDKSELTFLRPLVDDEYFKDKVTGYASIPEVLSLQRKMRED